MKLLPRINPVITFKSSPVDISIFNYPRWKKHIADESDAREFNTAWLELFGSSYHDCRVEYGEQELMGNRLGSGLAVCTPTNMVLLGGFGEYTDEPVLAEDQTFYYSCGVPWGIDLIGQLYYLIDSATNLPIYWDKAYAWEIIKRYEPFMKSLKS